MDRLRLREIEPDGLYEVEVWDSIGGTYGPSGVEVRHESDGFHVVFTEIYTGMVRPLFGAHNSPEDAFEAFETYLDEYAEPSPEDEPNY